MHIRNPNKGPRFLNQVPTLKQGSLPPSLPEVWLWRDSPDLPSWALRPGASGVQTLKGVFGGPCQTRAQTPNPNYNYTLQPWPGP